MLDREEMELDEAEPTIFFSNSGGDALFDSLVEREAMGDTILLVCADALWWPVVLRLPQYVRRASLAGGNERAYSFHPSLR